MKIRALGLTMLPCGMAGVASAAQEDGHGDAGKSHKRSHSGEGSSTLLAPEIDSTALVAALTLLGGALAVLRGRRTMDLSG